MGTPPSATRPPLPLPLVLLAFLPMCLFSAETPSFQQSPPRVIDATNETLTFVADLQCPPNCNVTHVMWQIKTWVKKNWLQSEMASANLSHTFTGLVPGVLYDVRAVTLSGGPVAKAYTCSNEVAQPSGFWAGDSNETHMEVEWEMPRSACVSTRLVLQRAPHEQHAAAAACPPPFLIDPQPNITCHSQSRHQDECRAIIDGITPDKQQYIGVYAIDWKGSCSERDWIHSAVQKGNPLGDVQIALIASLVLAAILLAALIPLLHKLRKRLAGRGTTDPRFAFSRMKPTAAASAAFAVAQAPFDIDTDGYLLSSDPQTGPAAPPPEQQQS